MKPDDYLNADVDERRKADYTALSGTTENTSKIDANTDELEGLMKDVKNLLIDVKNEIVNTNGFLAVIESNTYPEAQPAGYIVNFVDIATNNVVATQRVEAGLMVDAPTREGMALTGTYTDLAGENEFDYDTQITQNMFLYTTWEAAE